MEEDKRAEERRKKKKKKILPRHKTTRKQHDATKDWHKYKLDTGYIPLGDAKVTLQPMITPQISPVKASLTHFKTNAEIVAQANKPSNKKTLVLNSCATAQPCKKKQEIPNMLSVKRSIKDGSTTQIRPALTVPRRPQATPRSGASPRAPHRRAPAAAQGLMIGGSKV